MDETSPNGVVFIMQFIFWNCLYSVLFYKPISSIELLFLNIWYTCAYKQIKHIYTKKLNEPEILWGMKLTFIHSMSAFYKPGPFSYFKCQKNDSITCYLIDHDILIV